MLDIPIRTEQRRRKKSRTNNAFYFARNHSPKPLPPAQELWHVKASMVSYKLCYYFARRPVGSWLASGRPANCLLPLIWNSFRQFSPFNKESLQNFHWAERCQEQITAAEFDLGWVCFSYFTHPAGYQFVARAERGKANKKSETSSFDGNLSKWCCRTTMVGLYNSDKR